MTKPKAVFIGPAFPYRGGIAAFNENLASTLQDKGWDCMIFTFSQQYIDFLFPGKNQLTTLDSPPNLNIKRAIYSTNPLNWLKITKEILALKPDLLVSQYWMPYMAPAFGTILRGVKKSRTQVFNVTVVHNFKAHEGLIGDKQLGKFLAKRSDLLVSLSENVAEDIRNTVPHKAVRCLFHPVYDHYGQQMDRLEACRKLNLDPDTKYLLFFGLVRTYKGLDLLIEALSFVQSDKKYKLIIAGEFYESEKKYLKLIRDSGLEDRIIVRNEYISNDDVPSYFCASDVVVLPYRRATQSGVIPVALHFERPIIVTNVGNMHKIIQENAIGLVANPEAHDLAKKIDHFLTGMSFESKNFNKVRDNLSWNRFYTLFMGALKENGFKQDRPNLSV